MDYPYILIYLLLLWLAYAYWKKPDQCYVKWAIILQFVFVAFRAPVVGADTWDYIRYLTGERNFYNYDTRDPELGFIFYRECLKTLGGSRFICMFINSILSCFPIYILYKKYSFNVPLSLALFSLFDLYGVYFVALRQILSLAIIFSCMIYLLEGKKGKWFIFICGTILAYTFHTTAILYSTIFIFAYLIKIRNRMIMILCILASAFIGVILQNFDIMQVFNFILSLDLNATERLNTYFENKELNEISSLSLSLRTSIIAIICFLFIDRDKINHWFSKIYFLGVVVSNLFVAVPMISRIVVGMTIFAPVVFTWIFGKTYKSNNRLKCKTNVILVILLFYLSQAYIKSNIYSNIDLKSSNRMHPYKFIWENYKNHPSIKYW